MEQPYAFEFKELFSSSGRAIKPHDFYLLLQWFFTVGEFEEPKWCMFTNRLAVRNITLVVLPRYFKCLDIPFDYTKYLGCYVQGNPFRYTLLNPILYASCPVSEAVVRYPCALEDLVATRDQLLQNGFIIPHVHTPQTAIEAELPRQPEPSSGSPSPDETPLSDTGEATKRKKCTAAASASAKRAKLSPSFQIPLIGHLDPSDKSSEYIIHGQSIYNDSSYQCIDFSCPCIKKYVLTRPSNNGTTHSIVSIDCEMILTTKGSEVARVSIVNEKLEVLYDKFVLPQHPIKDFLTEYSGITAEILSVCQLTFQEMQNEVLKIIHFETIVVGHSLNCDLNTIRIIHERVIDTSILYSRSNGKKSGLKGLAKDFLREEIQSSAQGHDSVEDARMAMRLALLCKNNGKHFCHPDYLTEFTGEALSQLLHSHQKKTSLFLPSEVAKAHDKHNPCSNVFPCLTPSETTTKLLRHLSQKAPSDFCLAYLNDPNPEQANLIRELLKRIHEAAVTANSLLVFYLPGELDLTKPWVAALGKAIFVPRYGTPQ